MRKILVTGSSGFIGAHTQRALVDRGDTLVYLADRRLGVDLSEPSSIDWMVDKDVDGIIHLAGTCSTPGSVARPYETYRDTVTTAAHVLEAARLMEVPIVVTSSVKARDGMTPYGAGKRMVELWTQEYRAAFKLRAIINRPGTIYGPGQEGSLESGWIAWFLEAKRRGVPVTIHGDGQQVRDLLHVSDYVDLLLAQIDDPQIFDTGEIYDVGGGWDNAVSVNEIVHYLELEHAFGPPRYGDAKAYVGLNNTPGWAPTTHWREGLGKLVAVPA